MSYENQRIQSTDTTMDVLVKMSDGNPGASMALVDILESSGAIDPQNALGGLGVILSLDIYDIYGTEIYILYSDKCDRDLRKFLVLMRSVQLGFFPESELKRMAEDQMGRINLSEDEFNSLDLRVCDQLEQFQKKGEQK